MQCLPVSTESNSVIESYVNLMTPVSGTVKDILAAPEQLVAWMDMNECKELKHLNEMVECMIYNRNFFTSSPGVFNANNKLVPIRDKSAVCWGVLPSIILCGYLEQLPLHMTKYYMFIFCGFMKEMFGYSDFKEAGDKLLYNETLDVLSAIAVAINEAQEEEYERIFA